MIRKEREDGMVDLFVADSKVVGEIRPRTLSVALDSLFGGRPAPIDTIVVHYDGERYEADARDVLDVLVGSGLFRKSERRDGR